MQILFKPAEILTRIEKAGTIYILHGSHAILTYDKSDLGAHRFAIVQISKMGVSDVQLEKIFGTHRHQIRRYRKVFEEKGLEGLAGMHRGRDEKVTREVVDYIAVLYERLRGTRGFQETILKEVKELFGIELTRRTLQRKLKELRERPGFDGDEKDARADEKPAGRVSAGSMLLLPLIDSSKVLGVLEKAAGKVRDGYYGIRDIIMTLLVSVTMEGAINEEQLKRLRAGELGVILGRKRIPSMRTVRRAVSKMVDGLEYRKLMRQLARDSIDHGGWRDGVFYVDGHFLPYYGKSRIPKGYHTVRRQVTRGRTMYFVHDSEGYPVYARLSDGYEEFRHYLVDIKRFLKGLRRGSRRKPTLVFDRGGCGKEVLEKLGDVEYICWKLKGARVVPEGAKWEKVVVEHESNEWGKPKLVEVQACEKEGKKTRDIWILRKDGKVSPAITNSKAPLAVVVKRLLHRWGAQENGFKILKNKGIDAISSYLKVAWQLDTLQQEGLERGEVARREVDNPKVVELKKRRGNLKRDIVKLEAEAGKRLMRPVGTRGKKRNALSSQKQQKLNEIRKDLAILEKRLKYLPEKINLFNHLKKEKIVRLASEKKSFLDIIKILAVRFEKDLINIVGPTYRNNRDIRVFCLRLLNQTGTVVKSGNKEKVLLDPMNTPKETAVLSRVCEEMNKLVARTPRGSRSASLIFAVNS